MKKLLLYIVSILLLLMLLSYLFEKTVIFSSDTSGVSKIDRILNEEKELEIPIFGSSRAKRNYVPSILGEDFYNYGIEGVQDNVVLFFLREELKKTRKTPIIVNFDLDGINSVNGDIKNYLPFLSNPDIFDLVHKDLKPYYNVPYFRYFGNFEGYLKDYLAERFGNGELVDQGASLFKGNVDSKTFARYVQERENSEIYVEHDQVLLQDYLELCKSTDRKIFFVISPNHSSYIKSISNNDVNLKFLNILEQLQNVHVIDFTSVNYPDEYYFNTTHLNYLGATKFTESLSDSLNLYLEVEP